MFTYSPSIVQAIKNREEVIANFSKYKLNSKQLDICKQGLAYIKTITIIKD